MPFMCYAQQYQQITGKIINELTNEPLAFTNIYLKNNSIGTISNSNGEFIIKIPKQFLNDTLIFSFIGFYNKSVPLNFEETSLDIVLESVEFHISEIMVHYRDPKKILLKALEKIPENSLSIPSNLTGFYRESVEENSDYIHFSEALLKIYKGTAGKSFDIDRVELLKGYIKPELKKSILWEYLRFINGPFDLLKADVTRYPNNFFTVSQNRHNFLKPAHFKYYEYTLMETYSADNQELYALHFKPRSKKKWVIYEGIIFIYKKNYAFAGVEYKFNSDRINISQIIDIQTRSELEEAGAILKAVDFYCYINFKPYKDKMIINQANMKFGFVFNEKVTQNILFIKSSSHLVITDITTENVEKIRWRDQFRYNTTLNENIKNVDESFWEDYNYIKSQ